VKILFFVTHNKNKFDEAKVIAEQYKIDLQWLNIEYEEIQADSIEEIARESCNKILEKKPYLKNKRFFLEDAGLFIDSLNDFPGPYSAYVFRTIGNNGILSLMKNKRKRDAYFKSVVALYTKGHVKLFEGITRGKITKEIRGNKGFGFDPIFLPEESEQTFGEINISTKNKFSHRFKSVNRLLSSL